MTHARRSFWARLKGAASTQLCPRTSTGSLSTMPEQDQKLEQMYRLWRYLSTKNLSMKEVRAAYGALTPALQGRLQLPDNDADRKLVHDFLQAAALLPQGTRRRRSGARVMMNVSFQAVRHSVVIYRV